MKELSHPVPAPPSEAAHAEPGESDSALASARRKIDRLNRKILALLQERAGVVLEIARFKEAHGLRGYDPRREREMLERLTSDASGPFGSTELTEVFQAIFRASLDFQDRRRRQDLIVHRRDLVPAAGIDVAGVKIGAGAPVLMVGPCSVETPEQMEAVAAAVARLPGPKILRAGAFKPRTSPYSFQGLREEGLEILHRTASRHGLATVSEVLDTATLDMVAEHVDLLQVGSRNMYNTELLKALGRIDKPVLLKRGFMATLEELLLSAEYILAGGNHAVVLCERGSRSFEPWTRNTLDIASIPLLNQQTSLPVIVDLSHALGRRDIMLPCCRAALSAGAAGLMIETHPTPEQALSDGFQQLSLEALDELVRELDLPSEGAASSHG